MFEGKHIHCSPVDQKLLCSYSTKVCRQRRLNGYGFCIRHILEDSTSPYKQCKYVTTRNSSQKCLNAIPELEEREYCHSHLQVTGAIPKAERKTKNASKTGEITSTSLPQGFNLASVNNNHSANNNFHSKNCKAKSRALVEKIDFSRVKEEPTTEQNNNTHSISSHSVNGLNLDRTGRSSPLKQKDSESLLGNKKKRKSGQTMTVASSSKKKNVSLKGQKKKKEKSGPLDDEENRLKIHPLWKTFKFNSNDGHNKSKALESLKDLKQKKIMEKCPLFASKSGKNEISSTTYSSSLPSLPYQQRHQEMSQYNISIPNSDTKKFSCININGISRSLPKVGRHLDAAVRISSRKEFLHHVKSSYKSRLETVLSIHALNKKEEHDSKALTEILLSSSLVDCAHLNIDSSSSNKYKSSGGSSDRILRTDEEPCSTNSVSGVKNKQKYLSAAATLTSDSNATTTTKSSHHNLLARGNPAGLLSNGTPFKQEIINSMTGNGVINLIDPCQADFKYLTELNDDHSITLDDSSPWMNLGMDDGDEEDLLMAHKLFGCNKVTNDVQAQGTLASRHLNLNSALVPNSAKLISHINKPSHFGFNAVTTMESTLESGYQHGASKKRRVDLLGLQSGIDPNLSFVRQQSNGLASSSSPGYSQQNNIPLQQSFSDFTADQLQSVLSSSASTGILNTTDGISNGTTFDPVYDHSSGVVQMSEYNLSDVDDLADSLDLPIDQEMANQASKLFEEGFEFNELFPDARTPDFNSDDDFGFSTSLPSARPYGTTESISVTPNF